MAQPLDGVRVLDWTIFQQGPIGSCLLADMGAEVIKIEEPRGEPARGLTKMYGQALELDWYFQNQNRGKKGIVLDLTKEAAREVLYKLVEKSDVFITNMRYRFVKRLNLDYETLRQYNPRLIYALSSGYGSLGPDAELPSADLAGQARGGIWSNSMSEQLIPTPIGGGVADEMGGVMTAWGILLALYAREKTGEGQMVEASLLGGQIELGRLALSMYLFSGHLPPPSPLKYMTSPLWNVYRCKDEKWVCVSVLQADKFWPQFCKVLGIQELEKDPKFENHAARAKHLDELMPKVRAVFLTRTRDEWVKALNAADVATSPVNDYADVARDPQVIENGYIVEVDDPARGKVKAPGIPVRLSKTPGQVKSLAPELGQHTEEVLIDILGYSWEDIGKLREQGVY